MVDYIKDFEQEVAKKKGLVVVDFTAGWCGPCQMFSPVFESVAEKINGVDFKKVDVDNQSDIAQEHGVMSVPTIVFFENGQEIGRKNGYMNEAEFTKVVEEHN